jgi:hypothetical protein
MDWAAVQSSPAFGFTVVGLIIVFGPLVAERLRLPGLLGLLAFGAIIGPNMLEVLPRFAGLQAVGSIGVLYLIFLAGLQLDLETFVRYRVISGGFRPADRLHPHGARHRCGGAARHRHRPGAADRLVLGLVHADRLPDGREVRADQDQARRGHRRGQRDHRRDLARGARTRRRRGDR